MKNSRKTKQKEIISKEFDKINHLFSAEELFKKVNKKDKTIGIATVYRFLKENRNKRKIHSYTCNRRIIYSKEENNHCHFICEKTGKIIHFHLENLDFLKGIKNKIPGSINSIQLEIKGECKDEKTKR